MPSRYKWYKNAIIYGLDVTRFKDINNDGIGDFKGLIDSLDYLVDLGVTCLWLLPFYPTQSADNGYDVVAYKDVDPQIGTLQDFKLFMRQAKAKGLRVIIDLVIHHTSIRHPWFIAATSSDPASRYKDYYIWRKKISPSLKAENAFPTIENGVWQYNRDAKAYYRHKFYDFEPDLNLDNKDVLSEVHSIIAFWLAFGVDGFRIDAAGLILRANGIKHHQTPEQFFKELNEFVKSQSPQAILLGEADVGPGQVKNYLGAGLLQVINNFLLNNYLFLSLATKKAEPLASYLKRQVRIKNQGTTANFVRNLDELNLMHLSESQKKEVMKVLAPEPTSQIYDRGIRRRLPPMLDGNMAQIKMIYSVLFALPGIPMFIYGEEIGMGDDLNLKGRNSVRLPMQWNSDKNGGFSDAPKKNLSTAPRSDRQFGYKKINVSSQKLTKNSLLNFFKDLIKLRKAWTIIGAGKYEIVKTNNSYVLGILYRNKPSSLLTLHNFSGLPQAIKINSDLINKKQSLLYGHDCLKRQEIEPYGYAWIELRD
jgi:maltose alpha-D-glucosyltransferase/alpha-amylase